MCPNGHAKHLHNIAFGLFCLFFIFVKIRSSQDLLILIVYKYSKYQSTLSDILNALDDSENEEFEKRGCT